MTTATSSFDRLFGEARSLMATGRLASAVPLLHQLVQVDPQHVEVRNALAVASLNAGQLEAAQGHLEAALQVAPNDALSLNQWAKLLQHRGDAQGALAAYQRLLAHHPQVPAARLAYALLLESQGDLDAAVLQYHRALRDAQKGGRWLSAESTPPGLRADVSRAMQLVERHRRGLCQHIMAPLLAQYGADDLVRVSVYVDIQLGDARYTPADARQVPTSFPFPGLPQSPYLDKRQVPEVAELEAHTPAILQELQSVLDSSDGHQPVFGQQALADEFLRSDRGPAKWDGYYFHRHGQRQDDNARRCPHTAAAIERLPLAYVPGHGPEVLYSTLWPGTHLLPHHGVTNVRIVGHLPLIVPEDCALRVAGIEHRWRPGEVVLFDDTYAHEAWNRSPTRRVVMIFDLWHPELSEVERAAVRSLQASLGEFNTRTARL